MGILPVRMGIHILRIDCANAHSTIYGTTGAGDKKGRGGGYLHRSSKKRAWFGHAYPVLKELRIERVCLSMLKSLDVRLLRTGRH